MGNDSGAYYFNGTNSEVIFGTFSNLPSDIKNFSVSLWVKPIDLSTNGSRHTIVGDAGNGGGWRFFQHDDELEFAIQPPASIGLSYELTAPLDWIHVVGVSKDDTVTIFINGEEEKQILNTNNTPKKGNLNLEVGRGTVNNNVFWKGFADDIRIYNDVLTEKNVQYLYEERVNYNPFDTITVTDTLVTKIYDSITVNVYDTISVMDTNFINIFDTSFISINDTIPIYDTTEIVAYDTIAVGDSLTIDIATEVAPITETKTVLYPNPSGRTLYIETAKHLRFSSFYYSIHDIAGKEIWTSPVNAKKISVDVSKYEPGSYLFFVINPSGDRIERRVLIINR